MKTPTADALKGLVGALRECGSLKFGDEQICWACQAPTAECTCPPSGRERQARAALAAFESRGRLRDDQGIRNLLHRLIAYPPRTTAEFSELIDAIEAHLFGPATSETP